MLCIPYTHSRVMANAISLDKTLTKRIWRDRRLPVAVEGPAFEVTELRIDPTAGEARVVLDDGSEEVVGPDSLGTDARTGRVECLARGGRARAAFSRAAHQALLERVEEANGHFFLRVGSRRLSIRAGA